MEFYLNFNDERLARYFQHFLAYYEWFENYNPWLAVLIIQVAGVVVWITNRNFKHFSQEWSHQFISLDFFTTSLC
jgi:low affinity Fe/Cu permease